MSKTLKELFDEHGSVWLAFNDSPNKKVFRPLGFNEIKTKIVGEDEKGDIAWSYPEDACYTLYQAPIKTKTVTMWSPVFKNDGGSRNGLDLHATKEDVFKTGYIGMVIGAAPIQVEVLDGN